MLVRCWTNIIPTLCQRFVFTRNAFTASPNKSLCAWIPTLGRRRLNVPCRPWDKSRSMYLRQDQIWRALCHTNPGQFYPKISGKDPDYIPSFPSIWTQRSSYQCLRNNVIATLATPDQNKHSRKRWYLSDPSVGPIPTNTSLFQCWADTIYISSPRS